MGNGFELIEQYTEKNYNIEELSKLFSEKMATARKDGVYLEFITHKPIYNEEGEVVGITTDFPAELNIYKRCL